MSTKEKVWRLLSENEQRYLSGEAISEKLSVSRSAVWKAVEKLRDEGLMITATTNRGYKLITKDQLSRSELEKHLPGCDIHFFDEIGSTNSYAKTLIGKGAGQGCVVVSRRQSAGRGRLGRTFLSPAGGIYLSVVLQPDVPALSALPVTCAVAVAAAQAIEKVCGIEVSIKWVNDLFYRERKIAGILTEGVVDVENMRLTALVCGIGLNFSTRISEFPAELQPVAGSLYDGPTSVPDGSDQSLLVATLVRYLYKYSDSLPDTSFLDYYRRHHLLTGRRVKILSSGNELDRGVVEGVDDRAQLLLRRPDGTLVRISTGEVSVRPQ